jgi:hypothetical protein
MSLKQQQQDECVALATINATDRDQNIRFYEYGHKYEILTDKKTKYTSVTTWVHSHFPKFNADEVIDNMMKGKNWGPDNKYWGMTPAQIKQEWNRNGAEASSAGTKLHKRIEKFMNVDELLESSSVIRDITHGSLLELNGQRDITDETKAKAKEWEYFLQFAHDHTDLVPYRTEWMIYDEQLKLAGSVDMVYKNSDGTYSIYDWKRSKDITKTNGFGKTALTECIDYMPDANFWHYTLQLNIYKMILERNYGICIRDLKLVRLHPDAVNDSYELLDVPVMSNVMRELVDHRLGTFSTSVETRASSTL